MTATVEPPVTQAGPAWFGCPQCHEITYARRFTVALGVCPGCGWHSRLTAQRRLEQLLDPGTATPVPVRPAVDDPLEFVDRISYRERLAQARATTGLDEAVQCVQGRIDGHRLVVIAMDFRFLGGSLGCGVGERFACAAEVALRDRVPLLVVSASGGARMQEGALALMQMAKTSQSLAALDEAGVPTITLVTDPTYGGVAASFATLADVIIAEPGAHIGFAGPRVIEQTIGHRLPEGFQTAEFSYARGLIDAVVPRAALRATFARLLGALRPAEPGGGSHWPVSLITRPADLPVREPWQGVRLARAMDRPTTLDYVGYLLDEFHELHGDRTTGDCAAIVGGPGRIDGRPVMVIGHQKGHDAGERVARNFGMPTPAGYRKAHRLMRLAEKLHLPVVTLVDTPGAHPGVEAEERGQAWAIAENLRLMARLRVPIVSVITGEGGSGGALALAVADRVLALENAIYSVISPEGCAAILWKNQEAAPLAAAALRLGAGDLLRHGIVDAVVPEPAGGAHVDPVTTARNVRTAVSALLAELAEIDADRLVTARRGRFGQIGVPAGQRTLR